MVRVFFLISVLFLGLQAQKKFSIFEANCIQCHQKLPVTIDKYFYKYLLKYSSEKSVKKAMYNYLTNPSREKTIMSDGFINRFGIKRKSNLSDEKLKKALDSYWERYKLFGKLK